MTPLDFFAAIFLTLIIAAIALLTLVALVRMLCRVREFVDEVGRQTETHP